MDASKSKIILVKCVSTHVLSRTRVFIHQEQVLAIKQTKNGWLIVFFRWKMNVLVSVSSKLCYAILKGRGRRNKILFSEVGEKYTVSLQ